MMEGSITLALPQEFAKISASGVRHSCLEMAQLIFGHLS
jgi:hypothetical protein